MARGKMESWLSSKQLALIEGWARRGLSEEQIAHNMGISRTTLYKWRKKSPRLAEAIGNGKEVADVEVENALFRKACGYDVVEVVSERQWNQKEKKYETIVTKTIKKHIAADVNAQTFWLKNRRPETWRDKREVVSDSAVNILSAATEVTGKILAASDDRKLDGFLEEGGTDE